MEKAKQSASRFSQEENNFKRNMDQLKPDINNLLHMYLPDEVTMKEAEIIALVINDMIWNPKDYLQHNKETK